MTSKRLAQKGLHSAWNLLKQIHNSDYKSHRLKKKNTEAIQESKISLKTMCVINIDSDWDFLFESIFWATRENWIEDLKQKITILGIQPNWQWNEYFLSMKIYWEFHVLLEWNDDHDEVPSNCVAVQLIHSWYYHELCFDGMKTWVKADVVGNLRQRSVTSYHLIVWAVCVLWLCWTEETSSGWTTRLLLLKSCVA